MQFARIVILCVLAAVFYGIVHDQITARICVEYFTIGHARLIDSTSPTVLGLVWGVVATWWVGLILGVLLAACCRAGAWPKLTDLQLMRSIAWLLGVMGVVALCAGSAGRALAQGGNVWLVGWLADAVPRDRHIDFLTALWAHSASYAAGAIGGTVLCVLVIRKRRTLARETRAGTTPKS